MRILFTFLICSFAINLIAQTTDFTDFRRKNEGFAHVTDKYLRSDLASFTLGGLDESIGKAQLKKIPSIDYGNDFIIFDSNQIKVTIKAQPFFATKHKLMKEGDHIVKIDNRPYFGNYGKMPFTEISSITMTIGNDSIQIPATAWRGLYNPQFVYNEGNQMKTKDAVYLSADKNSIYIYMLNMDSEGGYEVTWIIQNKQYLKRVIDYGFSQ